MTGATEVLLGETGVERAAVWSVVGFGLTLAAFRGAARLGAPGAWWVAAGCTAVAALGVIAFARVGGGAIPAVLLAYGPFAAALFETVGPAVTLAPGGGILVDAGTTEADVAVVFSIVEPFAVAVAAAVAVGGAGFVVGRGLGALGAGVEVDDGMGDGTGEGTPDDTESDED